MDQIIRTTPVATNIAASVTTSPLPTSVEDTTGRAQISVSTPNSSTKTGLFEYSQDVSESKAGVVRLLTKIHFPLRMPDVEAADAGSCNCCTSSRESAFEEGITAHAVITIPAKYRKMLLKAANTSDSVSTEPAILSVPAQAALAALILADRLVGEYGKSPTAFHHAIVTCESGGSNSGNTLTPYLYFSTTGGSLAVTAKASLLNQGNVVKRVLGLTK